jgi:hypothetical protein
MGHYRVMVDDNFHYMDKDERYEHGTFATAEEALAISRGIVEESLRSLLVPGMTAAELLAQYRSFGDDPFVVAADGATDVKFSAADYAQSAAPALINTLNGSPQ